MRNEKVIKPFLRWAGSKRQVLRILASYWSPKFSTYIEPFLGSASMFFYINPKNAILGDINSELISTYQEIKENLDDVLKILATMKKDKAEYYRIRSLEKDKFTAIQLAARFIYLNRFSFNGLYRTNLKGEFNVPYGGEKSGQLPDGNLLKSCSDALQGASLRNGDFEKVLSEAKPGDFVYLDPPYSVKAYRVFSEYNPIIFGSKDLCRLKIWLNKLTEMGVEFLLSYAQCDEAKDLMQGFSVDEISVRRNIAGFSNKRRKSGELLISNRLLINN